MTTYKALNIEDTYPEFDLHSEKVFFLKREASIGSKYGK